MSVAVVALLAVLTGVALAMAGELGMLICQVTDLKKSLANLTMESDYGGKPE